MTWIRTIAESAARGELAKLYRRLAYRDGTVDAAFKALSLNPGLLAADATLYDAIMYADSPLSRAERESLALTVSRLNGCERCLRHHAVRLQALQRGGNPQESPDEAGMKRLARSRALAAFAEKLTREPGKICVTDLEQLRHAGLDDRAILDACNVVAYFNYANRVTLGLGIGVESAIPGQRPSNGQ